MTDFKAYRIKVLGKVQGVFFRKHTQEKATELGLVGTVENLKDGSVLINAEGEETALSNLLNWCYEGSPASVVSDVKHEEIKSVGYSSFSIKR
ncbi:acylphosphatase [Owenweeksia hongkongensis]|uniref:acylphosphatase n=1 Tax=Owenweeksia hongkongensis TaxID=253245 RepID=UPI003A9100DF